jgi:hypothetical protein
MGIRRKTVFFLLILLKMRTASASDDQGKNDYASIHVMYFKKFSRNSPPFPSLAVAMIYNDSYENAEIFNS